MRREMTVKNIKRKGENIFEIDVFAPFDKKAITMLSEANVKIISVSRLGVLYFLKKYVKRPGLLIGAVCCLLFFIISSMFVWEIKVTGNETLSQKDVKTRLASLGFKEGTYKRGVNLTKLCNEYLISDYRVSWIFINFGGTVANVQIKETHLKPKPEITDKNVNLVASRDGIIMKIMALDGQSVVVPGDVVTKGQLLVSGIVTSRKQNEILTGARGSVFAQTYHTYTSKTPMFYYEKNYTGKTKSKLSITAFGKTFNLSKKNAPFDKYDKTTRNYKTDKFPYFKITKHQYFEYNLIKKDRSKDEAIEISITEIQEKINSEIKDCPIISKKQNISEENGYVMVEVMLECIENIAKEMKMQI